MATYQSGNTVAWGLTVTSDGTTPADLGGGNPTATVALPDGTTVTASVSRESLGHYVALLANAPAGLLPCTWTGSGENSGGLPFTEAILVEDAHRLFELSDLGAYLRQDDLDPAAAARARIRAENYLRVELGVEFDLAQRTLTERVPATRTYQPLPGPLVSVESVAVDGAALSASLWEVTKRGVQCPAGFGQNADTSWVTIEIGCTSGFSEIPTELSDWGIHLAGIAYTRGPAPGVATSTVTVEGVSASETYTAAATGGDVVGLPEQILRGLRARYGSGRPRAGSVQIR